MMFGVHQKDDEEGSPFLFSPDHDISSSMDETTISPTSKQKTVIITKENNSKNMTRTTMSRMMMMMMFMMGILVLVLLNIENKSAMIAAGVLSTTSTSDYHDSSKRCMNLDFNQNMDTLISNSKPIFITMPTKAAGQTMGLFVQRCLHDTSTQQGGIGEFLNHRKDYRSIVTNSLEVMPILTSHSLHDQAIIDLVKNSHEKALIIYIHRDETDRIKSAIRHVFRKFKLDCKLDQEKNRCVMEEQKLLDAIEEQEAEIKYGSSYLLTCDVYDAIVDNAPTNMVFLHYKQVNQLQKLLEKHYCPDLSQNEPIKTNYAESGDVGRYVQLPSSPAEDHHGAADKEHDNVNDDDDDELLIELDEWLDKKIYYLEWALRMREKATCQSRTKLMEHELFQCPHEAIRVPGVADSYHW